MKEQTIKNWHALKLEEIKKELGSNFEKGLTTKEAAERQRSFGLNQLPKGKEKKWWQILLEQFKNPMIFVLIFAAIVTFWIAVTSGGGHEAGSGIHSGEANPYADTIVITIAILVNVAIGFWQEFRSNNLFEKLQNLVTVTAQVKRDGKIYDVDAKELVPGDTILVHAGMKIPADARLVSAQDVSANEALLTGESLPVKKSTKDILDKDTPLAERENMIYTGTVIEKGEGEAVIVATGEHTELGQIAKLTANVEDEKTPLQNRLSHLGEKITVMVMIFAALIFGVGFLTQGHIVEMFTLSVAVAVAAIPEGLPAAMSIVLAVASQKILKKKGLVKTLLGAESLGSTTVICTDKTGTLTEGRMKVEDLYRAEDKARASLIMALANEAQITGEGVVSGEATDKAKLEFFLNSEGDLTQTLEDNPRMAILPFSSDEKYLASYHQNKDGKLIVFVSGAPERILEFSNIPEEDKKEILGEVEELASKGFRMIGLAERTIEENIDLNNTDELRGAIKDLEFRGVAAIRDPIREDVPESIEQVRNAGVRVIMITGDHKLTARSIGGELGFRTEDKNMVEGSELEVMPEEELRERINDIDIISRASPKHKMQIISALRENDEVVAMTGDGVNDAPALKNADLGISLGAGTDVTKEAADLILVNDSFSTIVEAIKEGRIAFDNIRKVTIFTLTNGFTEIILISVSLIARLPFTAITAVQILWANLVEDGLPALSLAFEPGEDDIMQRKPFERKEPVIDKLGMYIIFIVGVLSDFILVGLFLSLVYLTDLPVEHIQSVMFAALATDTLIYIFSIKALHKSAFHRSTFNNKYLLVAVGVGFSMMLAGIYVPYLNGLLGTIPLDPIWLLAVIGTGTMRFMFVELTKWWLRRRDVLKRQHEMHNPEESPVV
ncbi:MAG: HAD-IC family P-type ATPase [Candidatus Spechtbacterales bacterium]|nr:HAD-IC family P-type ATPase [Candidatus Spechtbacterales bacterium]